MSDLLSSVSLLLALVTLFLGYMYPMIQNTLDRKPPDEAKKKERRRFRKTVLNVLFTRVLTVLLMFAVLFYVCLPKAVNILQTSQLELWDFDYTRTIFLLVEAAICSFLVHMIIVSIKLIVLWKNIG